MIKEYGNRALSDSDINKYFPVYDRSSLKQGNGKSSVPYGIINIDRVDGNGKLVHNGTHWVAFYKNMYYDPFGFPPPDDIKKTLNITMYSTDVNQGDGEVICGHLSMLFLFDVVKSGLSNILDVLQRMKRI